MCGGKGGGKEKRHQIFLMIIAVLCYLGPQTKKKARTTKRGGGKSATSGTLDDYTNALVTFEDKRGRKKKEKEKGEKDS